jgi:predicted amidophosphoribosyltransferase
VTCRTPFPSRFPLDEQRRCRLYRRVLWIDDVQTTGAAASVCTLLLKRVGAKSVTLLALAGLDRRVFQSANEVPTEVS